MSVTQCHQELYPNIWCQIPFSICTLLPKCLAASHLHSQMLIDFFHCCLELIPNKASLVAYLCRFPNKQFSVIHTLNCKKRCTLLSLCCLIVHCELNQREQLHRILPLVMNENLNIQLHTIVHSFCLNVHLEMKYHRHGSVNSQVAIYLVLECWGYPWSSVQNNPQ